MIDLRGVTAKGAVGKRLEVSYMERQGKSLVAVPYRGEVVTVEARKGLRIKLDGYVRREWVTDEDEGADDWGWYADERRRISDVIAANEIDNLLMVSGDAHMVAIDDGTNTDYSTVGDAGFPLIHAAALDRRGSTKGGPYSHGAIGGGGQYAVVDIDDDGDVVTVRLQAKNHDDEVLLAYEFTVGA